MSEQKLNLTSLPTASVTLCAILALWQEENVSGIPPVKLKDTFSESFCRGFGMRLPQQKVKCWLYNRLQQRNKLTDRIEKRLLRSRISGR